MYWKGIKFASICIFSGTLSADEKDCKSRRTVGIQPVSQYRVGGLLSEQAGGYLARRSDFHPRHHRYPYTFHAYGYSHVLGYACTDSHTNQHSHSYPSYTFPQASNPHADSDCLYRPIWAGRYRQTNLELFTELVEFSYLLAALLR
jgi:hypothetical protein